MSWKAHAPKTPKVCQRHAIRRARERYGLTLRHQDLYELRDQIHAGRARFLFKESKTRTHFNVLYHGKYYPIVYDTLRKAIVTFLPTAQNTHIHETIHP